MKFQYPLGYLDVISQEDVDTGRVNLCMNYKDYVHSINKAFYDGFLLALCETQEDFDSITPEIRIKASLLAKETALLYGQQDANHKRT